MLLGNGVWQNRYGGDPAMIGRTIKVNEQPATVIGVMPEGIKFPINTDIWMPLVNLAGIAGSEARRAQLQVVRPARRRRHASRRRSAELTTIVSAAGARLSRRPTRTSRRR